MASSEPRTVVTTVRKNHTVPADALVAFAPIASIGGRRQREKAGGTVVSSNPRPSRDDGCNEWRESAQSTEKEFDMRPSRIAIFVFFMACSASAAWAQYGLYGSPDILRLPPTAAAQDSSAPQTYPSTSNPSAQLPPAPAYQPAPIYQPRPTYPSASGYPSAPAYRVAATGYPQQYCYPVQPTAAPAYQPYQPAAQYQYPNQYAYPPARMAAAGQQPAAQPLPSPPAAPVPSRGGSSWGDGTFEPEDAPAPQGAGMVNQMLDEQGGGYGGGLRLLLAPIAAPSRAMSRPPAGPAPMAPAIGSPAAAAPGTPPSPRWS